VSPPRHGDDPDERSERAPDPHGDTAAPDAGGADEAPQLRPRSGYRAVGVGDQLGRYQLEDELGTGGMATVYRARDRELRREVAIKVLFPHLAKQADVVRRFHREARAAAALEHPNILRVYDVGGGQTVGGDPPFIVMELVRGRSLRELHDGAGPIVLAEVVAAIGCLIADALALAHRAGIVHRDVKPANVMAADDGRLLLADFGVARLDDDDGQLTRTGAMLGTPAFMAPEQAAGEATSAQSDVYALGATLYVLATGQLPGSGRALVRSEPVVPAERRRPAVGAELSRALAAMMQLEPGARPADVNAAAAPLARLLEASGLGEPRAVVARYLAGPASFDAANQPTVVASLCARAEAHARGGERARAMALADRAAALAPDDGKVATLVAQLAQAPAGRGRRIALAAAGLALAGGATALVAMRGSSGGARAPGEGSVDLAAGSLDARVEIVAATVVDAGVGGVAPLDATPLAAGAPADARRVIDARRSLAVLAPDAAPIVPPPAAVDARAAAPLPVDAAPAPGAIVVAMDAWCDVFVDGAAHGRADRARPITVSPGRHAVRCTQGPGLSEWAGAVTVAAGQTETVRGSLRRLVAVTIAVGGDGVTIDTTRYASGRTIQLASGRYRVELHRAGGPGQVSYVDIPRVASCTLKTSPSLDCY
jgi:predicted Ser/Thr protein kinase